MLIYHYLTGTDNVFVGFYIFPKGYDWLKPCPSEIFAIAILLSITIVPKLSAGTEKLLGPRIEILTTGYWP